MDVYRDCFHGKMGGSDSLCQTDTYTDAIYTDECIRNQALDAMEAANNNNNQPDTGNAKPWFLQVNFAGPRPPTSSPLIWQHPYRTDHGLIHLIIATHNDGHVLHLQIHHNMVVCVPMLLNWNVWMGIWNRL